MHKAPIRRWFVPELAPILRPCPCAAGNQVLLLHLAAQGFRLAALAFGLQPALFRSVGGLGGPPHQRRGGHTLPRRVEPPRRIGAVLLLAAVLLGFDAPPAVLRDGAVAQRQQASRKT